MADLYGTIPISGDVKKTAGKPHKKEGRQQPQPRKSGRRLLVVIPLVLFLLFAGYYGASSVLVPYFIKDTFPEIFQKNTGLSLSVDTIDFNPLDCSIIAEGIHISSLEEDGPGEDFLTIGELLADLDVIQLLRRSIVSESLVIRGATFSIFRYPDKTYNISRFFSKNSGEISDMMDFAELPFLYSLNNISVHDSTVIFNDASSGKIHRIEDLELDLPTLANFSFTVGHYIQPRFSAVVNGSPVQLSSSAEQTPRSGKAEITRLSGTLQSIDLPLYADYLPVPLPVVIEKGTADAKIELSFQAQEKEGGQLALDYQFQVRDGLFRSHDNALTLAAPAFNLQGSLNPLKSEIDIAQLLLRDPILTVRDGFSAATVDSLFLKDYDRNASSSFPLDLPSITSTLLIADNGRVLVETAGQELILEAVQLSMRNFANRAALNGEASQGTFRLSADSENNHSHYSWQGEFESTSPVGDLEISNMPLAQAVKILTPGSAAATSATGSVDVRGRLSLQRSESAPLAYTFDKGTLLFSSIRLAEDGTAWLHGSTGKAAPVSITPDSVSLGSLFLNNGEMILSRGKLPALLQEFTGRENGSIQGIDLKGSITVLPEKEGQKPVLLKNVHLQAADLEAKAKKDNFIFRGFVENGGDITLKGSISTSPLSGTVKVGFSDMPGAVLPEIEAFPYSLSARALVNGTGRYDLAAQKFEGSLEIREGTLSDKSGGRSFSFDKAAFDKLSADVDFSDYHAEKLLIRNLTVEDNGMKISSAAASIDSISRQGEDFKISGLVMPESIMVLKSDLPTLLLPFLEETRASRLIEKVQVSGTAVIHDGEGIKEFLDDFKLEISTLSNRDAKGENFSFTARFTNQGEVSGQGSMALSPLRTALNLNFENIATGTLHDFTPTPFDGTARATLSGEVRFEYPDTTYSGDIRLADGLLQSKEDDRELMRWQEAILSDFSYKSSPPHLNIGKLTLDSPRMSYADNGEHFYTVLRRTIESRFAGEPDEDDTASFSRLDISRTSIQNGSVAYLNQGMSPPWSAEVAGVEGYINNFHLSDSPDPIEYAVSGTVSEAPFSLRGTVLPSQGPPVEKRVFELEDFPLQVVAEQLAGHFDLELDDSTMNMVYSNIAENPEVQVQISSLHAAEPASAEALTFALLSDGRESFSETIPLTDPSRPLFRQVVNHFQRLLIKSSVSPYLLLKEPYDGLQENSGIAFLPGETQLSGEGLDTLSLYAMLLGDTPRLQLVLSASVDISSDTRALRQRLEQAEQEKVDKENARLLREWQERQVSPPAVQQGDEIRVEDLSTEELQEFTPVSVQPVVITDEMLEQLGRERIEKVRDLLLGYEAVVPENIDTGGDIVLVDEAEAPQVHIALSHIGQSESNTLQ